MQSTRLINPLRGRSPKFLPAVRPFSTAPVALAGRRQGGGFQRSGDNFSSITGRFEEDGLTRYEVDFLETAAWTKDLLLKMKNAGAEVEAFTPPPSSQPLCINLKDIHRYDFTLPNHSDVQHKTHVTLSVSIKDLDLTPKQRHKLLLLAGNAYDPYKDVITFEQHTKKENFTGSFEAHQEKNIQEVVGLVQKMVKEAKEGADFFEDIPVNLTHVKQKLTKLEFPKEWLRPRDAVASSSSGQAQEAAL
ncbi:37S ribosomal protein S24, mitochondrial [Rhizophlyctis rosea]|nr:37S ribosomal protein S24, mitochondrial [Rhizophlyctis rosea]